MLSYLRRKPVPPWNTHLGQPRQRWRSSSKMRQGIFASLLTLFMAFISLSNVYADTEKAEVSARTRSNKELPVPFIAQVPPGNWSRTKNCGQTSVLMVMSFHQGKSPSVAGIQNIDDWLYKKYRDPVDQYNGSYTTTAKLAAIAKEFGGFIDSYKTNGWKLKTLREKIDQGQPVIVAIIAKHLSNRGYDWGGGHFVVVKGYTNSHFIVHDPGTTKGANKYYSNSEFQKAFAAQNGAVVVVVPSTDNKPILTNPPNKSEGVNPDSIDFTWQYNNNLSKITGIAFTLREENGTRPYVGSCGKAGYGLPIGIRESFSLIECGTSLKPNKWYKWNVLLEGINKGKSAYFKTGSHGTNVPTLFNPSSEALNVDVSDFIFEWSNNNDPSNITRIDFTLREVNLDGLKNNYVGRCGEHGQGISIGMRNTLPLSYCGASLKPNTEYKWAIGLYFGDDTMPTKGSSAYFKTRVSESTSQEPMPISPEDESQGHSSSSIEFLWANNNPDEMLKDMRFVLVKFNRETEKSEGFVGSCDFENEISVVEHYSLSQCGETLEPNQWYRWIFELRFKNADTKSKIFASDFKTTAFDEAELYDIPTQCATFNGAVTPQLEIPCLQADSQVYKAGLNLLDPVIFKFELEPSSLAQIDVFPSEECSTFAGLENKLYLPCVKVGEDILWVDLLLINAAPFQFKLEQFGSLE